MDYYKDREDTGQLRLAKTLKGPHLRKRPLMLKHN
jgi:hypothetical protein